jgi:hypothetical protein
MEESKIAKIEENEKVRLKVKRMSRNCRRRRPTIRTWVVKT